ncbi:uncharacterized protein RCC_09983 [Ramularia collo-cygni]|uniref:Uncharacterized protein n=1 Tax=Ramularia collo-cygni TaxID=112498 RepID=A0A2D3VN34_9PEZI|nr:uncharacterized protein RCC_09983 [Ramularia collo-cygni]CZT24264.1 uncharacterized protein RCC_09983 [Ramularia collo-cygni]
MARMLLPLLLAYFLALTGLSNSEHFLYGRQSDVDPFESGLQCINRCDVGGGCSGSSCPIAVRSVPDYFFNASDITANFARVGLDKRAFENQITNNAEAAAHVIEEVSKGPDGFFDDTVAAVSYMTEFGNTPFTYGTKGLHGCTMLTVVSKRAVYMAHFWETYSTHGDDDIDDANSKRQYEERVIKALTLTPVPNPYNPPEAQSPSDRTARNHKYIKPNGDVFNPDMFNQRGDNAQAFIMTPLEMGVGPNSKKYEYAKKINLLVDELKRVRGLRVTIVGYQRLQYKIDDQGREVEMLGHESDWAEYTNPQAAKGHALFEYDGDGNWRLFYEDKFLPAGRRR